MTEPQQVNVNHGCGCGSFLVFLLVVGLIATVAEDISANPTPWIIGFIAAAVVGGVAFYFYSQQDAEPVVRTPAPPPQPTGSKVCPECAETVQAAARVCRFCGFRWKGEPL